MWNRNESSNSVGTIFTPYITKSSGWSSFYRGESDQWTFQIIRWDLERKQWKHHVGPQSLFPRLLMALENVKCENMLWPMSANSATAIWTRSNSPLILSNQQLLCGHWWRCLIFYQKHNPVQLCAGSLSSKKNFSPEVAFELLTQQPRVQNMAWTFSLTEIFLLPWYFSHYCSVCGQYWEIEPI